MTIPPSNESAWDRMFRAYTLAEERLTRVVSAMEESNIPYAVVGGHAVAYWVATVDEGATRGTPDVDIVARRTDLKSIRSALLKAGFIDGESPNGDLFRDGIGNSKRCTVDLIFEGEIVTPHPSELVAVGNGGRVPVAT